MAEANDSTKWCPKCNRLIPLVEFGRDKQKKSGIASHCNECKAKARREWVAKNPEKANLITQRWEENNRGRRREIKNAFMQRHSERIKAEKNAHRAANLEEYRRKERERYWRNPDHYRAKKARWAKAHPEYGRSNNRRFYTRHKVEYIARYIKPYRARKRGAFGSFTQADIRRIWNLQMGRCAYCKKRLTTYHIDHIKPLIAGGSNLPSNLQLTCEPCNLRKAGQDPIDFARRTGRLL